MIGNACRIVLAAALVAATPAAASAQATIQLFNADPAGVGFNDPTPATPVGGNPGTTVGVQRQLAFVRAAQIWAQTISSQLPIRIVALHDPTLPCTDTAAALAGAAPFASVANIQADPGFPGLTPDTWYPISLAEKRTNVTLADRFLPTQPFHIFTIINPRIGQSGCLPTSGWYYGLDTNTPAALINFVTVLLHELGHGFGFTVGPTNASTGVRGDGLPSVWEAQMLDVVLGGTWQQMNDAARAFSARNGLNLVWQGSQTAAAVPETLAPGVEMVVQGAPAAAGTYQAEPATFGGPLPTGGLRAVVSPAVDLGGVSTFDGCEPIVSDVTGRIALVDRGTCTFAVKAQHAQDAGAVALIVANNLPGMFLPGGTDPAITIPVFGIAQEDGARLRSAPPLRGQGSGGLPARLQPSERFRLGTTAGLPRLFAPPAFQQGSSVSHWDITMTPNQLMEPAITPDLQHVLTPPADLTFRLLQDIGW